ncbi:MAG: hypothetical protein NT141_04460 [candidate division WWE3 bacterium]|nr:hypothetical protein [candidate division WWE3 bacterium]
MRKERSGLVGRPLKITPKLLEKLDSAFLGGHTDEESCLIAKIDPKTLYNYCKENPDYSSRKELLKHNPKLIARRNIIGRLNAGDVEISKWYLERKARSEFSTKIEIDNELEATRAANLEKRSAGVEAILGGRPKPNT